MADDDTGQKVALMESKMEEYYLYLLPEGMTADANFKKYFSEWPYAKFCIANLYRAMSKCCDASLHHKIGDKLIDIKLHYTYLHSVTEIFLHGITEIVGAGNYEKLNPRTISLLRGNQYKVFLISIVTEQLLDLLEVVLDGKSTDPKKGKWKRRIELIEAKTTETVITKDEAALLLAFKEQYRTAEFHKFSTVRGFLSKDRWNHFEAEKNALAKIMERLYAKYVPPDVQTINGTGDITSIRAR